MRWADWWMSEAVLEAGQGGMRLNGNEADF